MTLARDNLTEALDRVLDDADGYDMSNSHDRASHAKAVVDAVPALRPFLLAVLGLTGENPYTVTDRYPMARDIDREATWAEGFAAGRASVEGEAQVRDGVCLRCGSGVLASGEDVRDDLPPCGTVPRKGNATALASVEDRLDLAELVDLARLHHGISGAVPRKGNPYRLNEAGMVHEAWDEGFAAGLALVEGDGNFGRDPDDIAAAPEDVPAPRKGNPYPADEPTAREWEIVLSCADCGITDQDNVREATEAVTKFAAWLEVVRASSEPSTSGDACDPPAVQPSEDGEET